MKSTAFWIHHFLHVDNQAPEPTIAFRLRTALKQAGTWISQHLCDAGEPRVWKTGDRSSSIWHAYDPILNEYAEFDSELETRIWLEKRYNQPAKPMSLQVLR